MKKVIYCKDVGFDCEGVIRANTEEEAMQQAVTHAREVHGVTDISEEVVSKIKSVMQEE